MYRSAFRPEIACRAQRQFDSLLPHCISSKTMSWIGMHSAMDCNCFWLENVRLCPAANIGSYCRIFYPISENNLSYFGNKFCTVFIAFSRYIGVFRVHFKIMAKSSDFGVGTQLSPAQTRGRIFPETSCVFSLLQLTPNAFLTQAVARYDIVPSTPSCQRS
jgi:hypothetical protein